MLLHEKHFLLSFPVVYVAVVLVMLDVRTVVAARCVPVILTKKRRMIISKTKVT